MFLWIGLDIDTQLLSLKEKVKEIEFPINFSMSNISNLPMHISLKMPSEISDDQLESAIKDVEKILSKYPVVKIKTNGIELHETISWLACEDNEVLNSLHNELVDLFTNKYNCPARTYDSNFQFHSTLFLDNNVNKVKEAFLLIKDEPYPEEIISTTYIIGGSIDNSPGSYKVFKTFTSK